MKKILLLFMWGILPGFSLFAQKPERQVLKMSLTECIDYALKNSYNRQLMKLDESSFETAYKQSKSERLPDLSANLSETLNHIQHNSSTWDGSYSLSSKMILFQGGQISGTIQKNKLSYEQSQMKTVQHDNNLIINILQTFLTAIGNEELLNYQHSLLAASETQVEQGKIRILAGEILESDYLLLESQLASDRNSVLKTTINRDNSLLSLRNILSMELSIQLELIYPNTDEIETLKLLPTEENVLQRAMNYMPEIKISNYNVVIAEAGVKISKAGYYPTISLGGSIGSGHLDNFSNYGNQISTRFNQQVGLTVSVPIFSKGRTKANITQSRIAQQQAELDRMQAELDLQQTILGEYRNVIAAISNYETSQIKEQAYLKSFDSYTQKYNMGSITTVELLQQQNNYISAMNEYIRDKYGFLLKRKILDVYIGESVKM